MLQAIYDFGITQEDPRTEFNLLDLQENDHLLCIASAGELPLTLACLKPGIKITAVDISVPQLNLCRLKMLAACKLTFPLNGKFLGYGWYDKKRRRDIYFDELHKSLDKEEQKFWIKHLKAIENGVVRYGRFEAYLEKLRWMAQLLIGKTNINRLLSCITTEEQTMVYDEYIAKRKGLANFFKIIFHPSIYKNRGLREEAMQHSSNDTGTIFYQKFRHFCTSTLLSENYFFQFFLAGECSNNESYPDYLREKNRLILNEYASNILWKNISLQGELASNNPGYYNKIHLSNIGDWLTNTEFAVILDIICRQCTGSEKMVYRYLQKNHFLTDELCHGRFLIDSVDIKSSDRFPFYELLTIMPNGRIQDNTD